MTRKVISVDIVAETKSNLYETCILHLAVGKFKLEKFSGRELIDLGDSLSVGMRRRRKSSMTAEHQC